MAIISFQAVTEQRLQTWSSYFRGEGQDQEGKGAGEVDLVQGEKEPETTKQIPKRQTLYHRLVLDKDCMLFI